MLRVVTAFYNQAGTRFHAEYLWSLEAAFPTFAHGDKEDVFTIEANGREKAFIKQQFTNIPMAEGVGTRTVWHGDIAKFIFYNLKILCHD